jgi:hypothetical protein
MSVNIETRSNQLFGRTMIVASVAGLVGVAITLAVAASLLLGRGSVANPVTAPASNIEPGYVDFGQRHRSDFAPVLRPGYQDYGQRHSGASAPVLEPGYEDYGQRQAAISAPALDSSNDDYGQRHRP